MFPAQDRMNADLALGRQLAARRRAAGHSQSEFAKLVFVSRSTIANIEGGRKLGTPDFWARSDQILQANDALVRGYEEYRTSHGKPGRADRPLQAVE